LIWDKEFKRPILRLIDTLTGFRKVSGAKGVPVSLIFEKSGTKIAT
jgi:hypothetical protein